MNTLAQKHATNRLSGDQQTSLANEVRDWGASCFGDRHPADCLPSEVGRYRLGREEIRARHINGEGSASHVRAEAAFMKRS